jgi:murein DD-endopeptidase MepM/ murein hydrolase activator NlpD
VRGSHLSITAIVALAAAFTSPAAAGATSTGGAEAASTATASSGGVSYATLPPEADSKPKQKAAPKKKRKGRGKRKRRRPVVPVTPPVTDSDHVFPIQGSFSFGGKDSRFGAGRPGHIHQGQDMSAPLGTPVVSPWAGTVEAVKYQAGGAGYYVVVDGDDEDRDYVFMHLRKGSILVERGQAVAKGQQLAEVGSTGSSTGPHLHFEIWVEGGWYTGGRPVDPLPFLQAWL